MVHQKKWLSHFVLPFAILISSSWTSLFVGAQCHMNCHGHGTCSIEGRCTCYQPFTGADCSMLKCPSGPAWADIPCGTDKAHQMAVCSNMGYCDYTTGKCACYDGFEGPACNRLSCPNDCNGHGKCLTLEAAAKDFDGYFLNHTTTYNLWDANMIQGCVCDAGFSGYDCSQRECNRGPDVRRSLGNHETVTLLCQCGPSCSGNFRISYRGKTSVAIPPESSNDTVALAIMHLQDTVFAPDDAVVRENIRVIFQGSTRVCGTSAPTTTTITFITAYGDIPALTIASSNLVATGTSATSSLYFQTTQVMNCTCHTTGCGGTFALNFDGLISREIPYNSDSGFVRASLLAIPTMQTANIYSVTVTPDHPTQDQLCPSSVSSGQSAFTIVIKGVMGNMPVLVPTSSLTQSGQPGGSIVVTSNDGSTPLGYCNWIGACDFSSGVCSCPDGYGVDSILGVCGSMVIKSSGYTGIEACPGLVDQDTWEVITDPNPSYLYFTSYNSMKRINQTGIYVHNMSNPGEYPPRLFLNMTGLDPSAVALDLSQRMLYYIDRRFNFIGRIPLDYEILEMHNNSFVNYNFTSQVFVPSSALTLAPHDLALDVRFGHRYAYFTVPGAYSVTNDGKIMKANLDGAVVVTTIVSGLDYPVGIALDLMKNNIYWTDGHNSSWGKVYRSELDGSGVTTIVSSKKNFTMPYGIALDLVNELVFVAVRSYPGGEGYIVSFTLGTNGTGWHLVAASNYMKAMTNASYVGSYYTSKEPLLYPERIMLDTDLKWVYYTDTGTNTLRRVRYDGTQSQTVIGGKIRAPIGMAIDFGNGPPRYGDYYDCYGHGYCTGFSGEFQCVCYEGWHGNCNSATCPKGPAWFDEAISTDQAHRYVECSNRGTCDRQLGTCRCQEGFEGIACERLTCPGGCNGHGKCMNMAEMAGYGVDVYGSPGGFTYGEDSSNSDTWDARSIQGCYCDRFPYYLDSGDKIPPYTGYDCTLRECPHGDDPTRRNTSYFEVQTVECYAEGGTYSISFRGANTVTFPWNATIDTVKTELLKLPTLGDIDMESLVNRTTLCSSVQVAITSVTFLTEIGKVPLLSINSTSLLGVMRVVQTTRSTKQVYECSNQGFCVSETGRCECFHGFTSSNYDKDVGSSGDCGYHRERAHDLLFLHLHADEQK